MSKKEDRIDKAYYYNKFGAEIDESSTDEVCAKKFVTFHNNQSVTSCSILTIDSSIYNPDDAPSRRIVLKKFKSVDESELNIYISFLKTRQSRYLTLLYRLL